MQVVALISFRGTTIVGLPGLAACWDVATDEAVWALRGFVRTTLGPYEPESVPPGPYVRRTLRSTPVFNAIALG